MKPIGVTQRVTLAAHHEKRDSLAQDWYGFLAALGRPWLPLPNNAGAALELAKSFGLGALILSGGDDIGQFPERDQTESALLCWAEEKKLPVIGVCRGFQFIQHWLGAEMPVTAPEIHRAARHEITLVGQGRRVVNSFHNFAPRLDETLMETLAVCTADNSLEAARKGNLLGLMWHPERERVPEKEDVDLFDSHLRMFS